MTEKIMIVDDDPGLLTLVDIMLRPAGYEVLKATDAIMALTTLDGTTPGIIILDVLMPEIDGIELCRLIRLRPATNDTPVIMLSARHDPDTKSAAYEAGADDYLTKPVLKGRLLDKVQSTLDARKH